MKFSEGEKMRKKIKKIGKMMILSLTTIILAISCISVLNANEESQMTKSHIECANLFNVLNSESALKKGIQGYIEIKYSSLDTKNLELQKGNFIQIDLYVIYNAHNKNKLTTIVNIDPASENGLSIEKQLGKSGETICLNDLVTYEPSGEVVLTSGKPTIIKMTIASPSEIADVELPIGPVGMTADVPIIHRDGGLKINVQ